MDHRINLDMIEPQANYEGYLWWSNEDKPDIYKGQQIKSQKEKPIWPSDTCNPFIIEGNLWCRELETSYLIRFIDGKYLVYKFDLSKIGFEPNREYLPNRMPDVDKLLFKEVWEEQPDPLCEDFDVLKPAFIAFVGFKNQEEKK